MAYQKLFKTCVDQAVGIGAVNQFASNLTAVRDSLAAQHGMDESVASIGVGGGNFGSGGGSSWPGQGAGGGGQAGNQYTAIGKHNTPLIPRGVLTVRFAALIGYCYAQWSANNFFTVSNPSAGKYFVTIGGLTQFWGKVSILCAGPGAQYNSSCIPYYGSNGGQAGLNITTLVPAASVTDPWVATQSEFCLTIFGRYAASAAASSSGSGQAITTLSGRNLGPRRLFPWFRRPG